VTLYSLASFGHNRMPPSWTRGQRNSALDSVSRAVLLSAPLESDLTLEVSILRENTVIARELPPRAGASRPPTGILG